MGLEWVSVKKLALASLFLLGAVDGRAASDPRAVAAAQSLQDALGGPSAWEKARFFRFDFVVMSEGKKVASFSHWWDRYDGRYRVEGVGKDGVAWQAYFNVNTRKGEFFKNGARTEGSERDAGLERAYGRFINDTYWLLAPWKTLDPGVDLEYAGEVLDSEGRACEEIKLSFEGVGLTPKDIYWMDIDRKTHRMNQWKYVLNGANEPQTVAVWKEWGTFGPIGLSTIKSMVGRPVEIRFENLAVSEVPDDAALTPPR
jgi:hypothetical protein